MKKTKRIPRIGDIVYFRPYCAKIVRAAMVVDVYPPETRDDELTVDLNVFDNDIMHPVHGIHQGIIKGTWDFMPEKGTPKK